DIKKAEGIRREGSLTRVRHENQYVAVQEVHQEQGFPIYLLCDVIGISRSSYYKWLNRTPTEEDQLNASLLKSIQQLYEHVKGIYGYRRMAMNMERQFNRPINEKRIYRLMGIADLKAVIRRKKTPYKRSIPQHIEGNQLNREFTADSPNQKWLTDVSEFKYGSNQKAYLSAIL
ncbi:IS3 family transposase, partial [Catellatospora coxensis]|uniref:IS3 family transposase n=1 Tax=Catellatospora coxensis TaxID=310354 RepID=UPI0031D44188